MKKIESLFITSCLFATLTVTGVAIWGAIKHNTQENQTVNTPVTQFGSFLATQHAIYANDFEAANKLSAHLQDTQYAIVHNTKIISEFLGGRMPIDAKLLRSEKTLPAQFIYDAYLVKNNDWKELHNRHKNDEAALIAPFRIWSAIANDWRTNTLKFIDKLPVNESWREFARGQIYAELGNFDKAAEHFELVTPDFMNINDYIYIMSFYLSHDMQDRAGDLKERFTARPAGMFLKEFDDFPNWSVFSGYNNALAFSLIQNVSHTQILMYSDMALLMMRFAEITAPDFAKNTDAIDYYMGQFFYTNTGKYQQHFDKINKSSPYYPFSVLRSAEKNKDIQKLESMLKQYPLFVPAVNKAVGHYIKIGDKRGALRVVNRAINNKSLNEAGRAFFLKSRAQIYYSFGDYDKAQKDIHDASEILNIDAEILALQAKIWAAQNREIENAYKYAMTLVTKNPSDIMAWDTLGTVVLVREGTDAALEIYERVGKISQTHSPLYLHLGDIYESIGDNTNAIKSYMRAIDLSDDGLIVVPEIERKIRKLK